VMRKGQLMTCPGHVRVTVLDPIPTTGRRPEEARAFARQVQDAIGGALGRGPEPDPKPGPEPGPEPDREPGAEKVSA
jgi:hypothetical protein